MTTLLYFLIFILMNGFYVFLNFNNTEFVNEEIQLVFKILIFTIIFGGWLYRKIYYKEVEE